MFQIILNPKERKLTEGKKLQVLSIEDCKRTDKQ